MNPKINPGCISMGIIGSVIPDLHVINFVRDQVLNVFIVCLGDKFEWASPGFKVIIASGDYLY